MRRSTDCLLVVDVQNDFMPGGALAVPRGDEIVPLVNRIAANFAVVVLTQDWHPAGHASFASSHPGRKPYETMRLAYGAQVLWPDHCVQGTPGAAFHAGLDVPHAQLVIRKGHHRKVDSYSAFLEADRKTRTGLDGYLKSRGVRRVFWTRTSPTPSGPSPASASTCSARRTAPPPSCASSRRAS